MDLAPAPRKIRALRIHGLIIDSAREPEILALAPHRVPSVDDDGLVEALELAMRL